MFWLVSESNCPVDGRRSPAAWFGLLCGVWLIVVRTWSRIVGTPSEKIVDRSKDNLIQMKINIIVFVSIASIVYF